jgi:hypothetical protein
MKYNICYKLDKYVKFGTLNKCDDGNMAFTVTQEQLEQLLKAIKNNCFNDKKIKEFNNKKYYSLYVFEDTFKDTAYDDNDYHGLGPMNTWALINGYS